MAFCYQRKYKSDLPCCMTDTILFYDYGHPHLLYSSIQNAARFFNNPIQILYPIDFSLNSVKPKSMLQQCKKHDIGQFI
jgi:hypothetical protein